MRHPPKLALTALLLTATWGCLAGFVWTIDYEFDVAAWRSVAGGRTDLDAASRGLQVDLEAADEDAAFSIAVRPGQIAVTVRNLGEGPLDLGLAEARFVDPEGRELPLLARGGAGQELGTRLEPGDEAGLSVWPRGWGRGEPTRADSPIDGRMIARERRREAEELARHHLGRGFEIVLPVGRGDSRAVYHFRFTVTRIVPRRISWA